MPLLWLWNAKYPLLGLFCLILVGSLLLHKGAYNRKPIIKEPVGPIGGFGCDELVLYGIRLLAPASVGKLSTNESAVM